MLVYNIIINGFLSLYIDGQIGLTMTWDNSNLRFKDESFTKKDYYFNDVLKKQVLFTHEKTPSELSSQGIGWYADLAGWHLTPKNSEGYGHFLLVPKKTIKFVQSKVLEIN